MKHKLLYLFASMLAMAPAWAQNAGGEGGDDVVRLELLPGSASQMSIEALEDGSYHITTAGGDPYVSTTELSRDLYADENYVCMEYYSPTGMGQCEFFFNQGRGFVGGREQQFAMGGCDDWVTYFVDISESREKFKWGAERDFMRFDTGTAAGLELYVRNIHFINEEQYLEMSRVDAGEIKLTQDAEGYYLISTPADLQELSRVVNCGGTYAMSNARLTADLDMADVSDYCPIGVGESVDGYSTGAKFKQRGFGGVFDGQGHVIKNLTAVYNKRYGQSGVFGIITGTVKNLGVDNYTFSFGEQEPYSGRHAALGAQLCEGTVENCWVVNSTVLHSGEIVAALLAGNYGGTVKSCWEYGNNIENYKRAGRLIGDAHDDNNVRTGTEINCVSEGRVTGDYVSKVVDCISDATAEDFEIGAVTFRLNGSTSENVTWYQQLGSDALPTLDSSHGIVYAQGEMNCDGNAKPGGSITYVNTKTDVVIPDHEYEDGVCVNCGHDMPGLMEPGEDGFIEIKYYTQLVKLAEMVNSGNKGLKARLVADIDLSPVQNFTPIGLYSDTPEYNVSNFTGVFDGNYHVIKNLTVISDDPVESGLFGRINGGGKVMNLGIVNATIINNASTRAGVLGGEIHATTVDNCWTAGEIVVQTDHHQASGLSGEGASTIFNNCWSTYDGKLTNAATALNNCYEACAEIAASGELCYLLNGKTFLNPTYYQTLGEDDFPVWDSTHARVYQLADESYASLTQDNYTDFRDDVIAAELEWSDVNPYQAEMQDTYEENVNALGNLEALDDFLAAYETLMEEKKGVQACMDAYAAYQAKYNEIKAYLEANPDFAGPGRVTLESYLDESIEPGDEQFPNGSYSVIMDERALDTETMIAETAFLDKLLFDAIASDYTPGSEITSLMANADFSQDKEGWDENSGTFSVYATDAEITHVAGTTSPFDMSQTLTGLKDGIYEVTVKANFRPDNDNTSLNYASFVYANGDQTYTKTMYEDLVDPEAEYLDETNFTAVGFDEENITGYAPALVTGHAKAFADGLYENRIVAYVTDGQLTLGVRTPGATKANVTRLADFHLYYQGDIESETATAAIDRTLEAMQKTADNLLNEYIFADDETYASAPNYPQELKVALQAALDEIPSATTGAEKYALVQKIGDLFNQIYEGKMAYIKLLDIVESLIGEYTGGEEISEQGQEMIAISDRVWGAYDEDPSYPGISTEEAIALAADIKAKYAGYMRLTSSGIHAMSWVNNGPFSYAISTEGGDPYAYLSALEEDLNEDQIILHFEYQSESTHNAEIFYSPIVGGNEIWFEFEATEEGEWKNMFIPLADALSNGWGKKGDNLRLDPIPDGETTLTIRKIRIISQDEMLSIKNGGVAVEHTGTADDPYQLATVNDLKNIRAYMHTGKMTYFVLTDDIDMAEVENWTPVSTDADKADNKGWMNWIDFDGQGHVIRNFSANGGDYASFFGVLCGNVRNVGFEDVDVTCISTGSGVLGGYIGHNNFTDAEGNKLTSTLENVWVTGKLNVTSSYCGGLVGNVGGPTVIKNCYTNLDITSTASYTGGIVGRVRDALTMQNVYAAGTLSSGGGIVGGGQIAATPASTYTNCVVWNNAQNMGTLAGGDTANGISLYDGTNFEELQKTVVAWGKPWSCDMQAGSYPVLDITTGIQQIAGSESGEQNSIYTLTGVRVQKAQKGLYIINGKKVMVK